MSANKQTRHRKPHKPRSDFQRLSRRFMSGFLRSLFLLNKPARAGQAGFVLPTTVLLLLVMTLTVGALSFRTVSRTQSTFLAREQKMLDNVAAPAADRAKAKLEYLFGKDTRMPGTTTPSSDVLATLMLNIDNSQLNITKLPTDPYKLPDETRIDINDDGTLDNAWSFSFDLNGDGNTNSDEIIAYSLLMDDSVDPLAVDRTSSGALNTATVPTATRDDDIKLEDSGEAKTKLKAKYLVTRNGPINTAVAVSDCGAERAPSQGWQTINNATLEKNFQITAFVSNGKNLGRANSALELQQVRLSQTGNTWGAWFKYDMEVHPGPDFNWNGAIHTDGNLMITNNFKAHMISSHNSCLYTTDASNVTMAQADNDGGGIDTRLASSEDFQGQLIAGAPTYGNLTGRGTPDFHILNGLDSPPIIGTNLTSANDSVQGTTYSHLLDIALDPVALFTENKLQHRRTGTWTRATDWATTNLFRNGGTGPRIFNESQTQPFLDDFYRADDRYGPRPNYQNTNWVNATDDGSVNTNRSAVEYDKKIGDEIISTDPQADSLTNTTDGLDGYWERKAMSKGMRVVVGQRLELGNHLGWNFDAAAKAIGTNTDPLYPTNTVSMANKQKQRVTLRDNLSAVQGMVVYQYENSDGKMPLACIANTAHPGTLQTLKDSRTFNIDTTGKPKMNFLEGQGTNGWEFAFPEAFNTESKFGTELANTRPLGIALRNLAYFAGDPNGGSPSFTPVQDTNVHPFAHQAMWGDFSVLRRIFKDELDNTAWRSSTTAMAARYTELSPADKSSLHSAACTMGLLAYNVNATLSEYRSALTGSTLQSEGVHLSQLIGGGNTSLGNPRRNQIERLIPGAILKDNWIDPNPNTVLGTTCPAGTDSAGFQEQCDTSEYYQQFTTDNWVEAYRLDRGLLSSDPKIAALKNAIGAIKFGGQLIRDRALGFVPGNPLALDALTNGSNGVTWSPTTGLTDPVQIESTDVVLQLSCDPDIFERVTGGGGPGSSSRSRIGLALVSCSAQNGTPIKYPSLYYLFPMVNHDHNGAPATGETAISPAFVVDHSQPTTEEYVSQVATYGVNSAFVYKVLGDTNGDGIETSSLTATNETGYADIAFLPKASDPTATTNPWKLPTTVSIATAAAVPVNPESMDIKIINGTSNVNVALSLLDKVMYNGREEMAVRVLDVDLTKLTRNKPATDFWIADKHETENGLLYAVREDAAREDSITRPAASAWASCDTLTELLTAACRMRASTTTGATPADPPLSKRAEGTIVGISTKPVDFAPDPDRRPNGFRLNADRGINNNGDLSNSPGTASDTNRKRGFTFVTDNAAYIKGTFNPHTSNGTTSDGTDTLEEFTQTLSNNNVAFGLPFYNNRTQPHNLGLFATKTNDRWRVAEVLADAVYLLSNNFVDGAVEEGFINSRTGTAANFGNSLTSFHNQQRPIQNDGSTWGTNDQWLRSDGTASTASATQGLPIWVGRNGESQTKITTGTGTTATTATKSFADATVNTDFELPDERSQRTLVSAAVPERMNATIISGIGPSRDQQGYGGLHNFPRFLEDWSGNLFIQGAFLQLNFSTAGTGPFDLDAWDPGDTPVSAERINYYGPPNRRWGYDVALQLSPTGPIAGRFVSIGRPRSEHYRELPIEDPYVTSLRCSKVRQVPTNASSPLVRRFPNEVCPP